MLSKKIQILENNVVKFYFSKSFIFNLIFKLILYTSILYLYLKKNILYENVICEKFTNGKI